MHNKKHTPKQVYFLEPLLVNSNKRKHLSYEYITKYLKSFFHVSEQNILITEHKNGKPHSPQLHLAYNASHSGNLISVAFSSIYTDIGCDLQKCSAKYSQDEIARLSFMQDERRYMHEHGINFFLFWSMKEAYIKYHGLSVFDMQNAGSILPRIHDFSSYSVFYQNEHYYLSVYPGERREQIIVPHCFRHTVQLQKLPKFQ